MSVLNPEIDVVGRIEKPDPGHPQELQFFYLVLPLTPESGVKYDPVQGSSVQEISPGLFEGMMWVEHRITLSRWAFACAIMSSLQFWKGDNGFYMCHGDSPKINRLRELTIIEDNEEPPVTIVVNKIETKREMFCRTDESGRLLVPVGAFARAVRDQLDKDGIIAIPSEHKHLIEDIQREYDEFWAKIPLTYL